MTGQNIAIFSYEKYHGKGLFIWEPGRDVCRDEMLLGIPACVCFCNIYRIRFSSRLA